MGFFLSYFVMYFLTRKSAGASTRDLEFGNSAGKLLFLLSVRYLGISPSRRRSPGFAVWWRPKWPFKCRGVDPGQPAGRRPPVAARRSLALAVAAAVLVAPSVVAVTVAVTVAVAVAVSISLVRARGAAGLVTSRAQDRASCAPCARYSGSGSAVL